LTEEHFAGLSTNWESKGSGPPLLMQHCAQGSLATLTGLSDILSTKFRCLLADSPGHGRSQYDPAQPYQIQATNAMIALLEREAKEPAILMGHSYGGTIAFRIAKMRPDLVRAMILYEPVNFGFLLDVDHPMTRPKDGSDFNDISEAQAYFDAEDWPNAARIFFTYWEKNRPWESLAEPTREYLTKTVRFITLQRPSLFGDASERVMLDDIKSMNIPVLVSHGETTREIAKATNQVITATLPNATLAPLPGAGHMGPIANAPAYGEIIQKWLASTL